MGKSDSQTFLTKAGLSSLNFWITEREKFDQDTKRAEDEYQKTKRQVLEKKYSESPRWNVNATPNLAKSHQFASDDAHLFKPQKTLDVMIAKEAQQTLHAAKEWRRTVDVA